MLATAGFSFVKWKLDEVSFITVLVLTLKADHLSIIFG